MSDFYDWHRSRWVELHPKLWALEYTMRTIVLEDDGFSAPWDLRLTSFAKRRAAYLVQRIFFEGKPPPRSPIHSRIPSIWDLLPEPDSKRNFALSEIARRLNRTPRDVRRRLGALREKGKIPLTWYNGVTWCPPVGEAILALQRAGFRARSVHTREQDDSYAAWLVQCRREREQLRKELATLDEMKTICRKWLNLTKGVSYDLASERKAFNCIATLAHAKKGWPFCKLFVCLYEALLRGIKRPVEFAEGQIGLPHASFYRKYSRKEIRSAMELAQKLIANPDWFTNADRSNGDQHSSVSADVASIFSEEQAKCPQRNFE